MDPKKLKPSDIQKIVSQFPDQVMDALLKHPFWPKSLQTDISYDRRGDDTDGLDSFISVVISGAGIANGDIFVDVISSVHPNAYSRTHRFRGYFGGGRSLSVRNAFLILARGIELDQKERPDPQHDPKPPE